MSREHWSSDEENAVDLLVQACNKPRASLEAPAQPHLIGRELTPYFSSDDLPALAPAKPEAPNGHSQKSSSKRQHASSRPRSAGQQSPVTTSKKTHASKGSSSSSEDEAAQQRSRKAPKASSPVAVPAPSAPPASFSCPGVFRASPRPDALPVPSSSLLLRAYHQAPLRLAVVA